MCFRVLMFQQEASRSSRGIIVSPKVSKLFHEGAAVWLWAALGHLRLGLLSCADILSGGDFFLLSYFLSEQVQHSPVGVCTCNAVIVACTTVSHWENLKHRKHLWSFPLHQVSALHQPAARLPAGRRRQRDANSPGSLPPCPGASAAAPGAPPRGTLPLHPPPLPPESPSPPPSAVPSTEHPWRRSETMTKRISWGRRSPDTPAAVVRNEEAVTNNTYKLCFSREKR